MNDSTGQYPVVPKPPSEAVSAPSRPKAKRKPQPRKAAQARRSGFRFLLYGLAITAVLCAAAAGLLFVRLMHGGISLASLIPSIERALSEDTGGRAVRVQSAEFALVDRRLVISLGQVSLSEPGGQILAQAPEAHAALSGSALRRGRFAINRLDLVSPRLNVSTAPDGSLTLSFAAPTSPLPAAPPTTAAATTPAAPATVSGHSSVDVVRALTEATGRARRRETSTGYLREIGLKQAIVVVANGNHRTVWNVPSVDVGLQHKRAQSSIQLRASIATLTGPLHINASTDETDKSDHLTLTVDVEGVNPRGLARLVPGLGPIETMDLPLAGRAVMALGNDGRLKTLTVEANAASGQARFGLLGRKPVPLDATRIALTYDGTKRAVEITDLTLGWAGNRLSMVGQFVEDAAPALGWVYTLRSTSGALASPRANQPPALIEQARASGRLNAAAGKFTLAELVIRAAGAEIGASGDVSWNNGEPVGQIDGKLSPMGVQVLTAIWPSVLAPGVRDWVSAHVTKGRLAGGLFKTAIEGTGGETNARLSLTLDASGVEVKTVQGMPPLEIARGLVRVEGQTIEVTTPEVLVAAEDGQKLQLRAARFTAVETAAGDQPTAEVAFRMAGSLAAALNIADREPLRLFKSSGVAVAGVEGKIDGAYKATFPLADNVQWSEVRNEGRVRVTDLRAKQVLAGNDISGGTAIVELGDKAVDVKGDILIKGVAAKLGWQYLLNQPLAHQPPARIAALLDTADRAALGLDVADLVQGETPVEVLVNFTDAGAQPRVRVDLTKAELTFEPIAWKKAPGRTATFVFDPVKGPGTGAAQRLELQNFKLAGDDIALEGWMTIGPDNKPREFAFPEFALNVVSRLAVNGKRKADGVWDITAKGPTFDGRNIFRGLFNVGQANPTAGRKDKPGYDIAADIDTVIGFSDTVVRGLKLKLASRAEKLVDLDAKATLATGKPFVATIVNQPGSGRQLRAEGGDAGQVFKVVGFYPSAVGGLMQLEVNLDAKGVNEKTGTLWARNFAVLGDSIVGDLYQNAESQPLSGQGPNQPRRTAQQRVTRQEFEFEHLYIPFAVGSGQFVMNKAAIHGPVIGASFRGAIDFKAQRVNLAGTYVPLSGLNQALGSILGPLTGGAQGEGLFGITFQVVGPLANPQVIANPLSLLGPGIFREIFQLAPENFQVRPRNDAQPAAGQPAARARPKADPARSSSASEMRAPAATAVQRAPGEVISDWTSAVKPAAKRAPRPADPPPQ